VSPFSLNPEFLRYARSQLRPAKLLSAAIISLVLSITLAFVVLHGKQDSPDTYIWSAKSLLETAFILQALVLAIGGGIACFNSIYSGKEQNTFDYQRISPPSNSLSANFSAPRSSCKSSVFAPPLSLSTPPMSPTPAPRSYLPPSKALKPPASSLPCSFSGWVRWIPPTAT
jgi:hypothetical protein